ncbi:MAG: hypothetical protein JWP29_4343, partial [Rhodoferax sp.]|nr:hypothetical protein [Rhodoferax sp.]
MLARLLSRWRPLPPAVDATPASAGAASLPRSGRPRRLTWLVLLLSSLLSAVLIWQLEARRLDQERARV